MGTYGSWSFVGNSSDSDIGDFIPNFTFGVRGSSNRPFKLYRVRFVAEAADTFTARVKVWDSAGTAIYTSSSQQVVATVGGQNVYFYADNSPIFAASTQYTIGLLIEAISGGTGTFNINNTTAQTAASTTVNSATFTFTKTTIYGYADGTGTGAYPNIAQTYSGLMEVGFETIDATVSATTISRTVTFPVAQVPEYVTLTPASAGLTLRGGNQVVLTTETVTPRSPKITLDAASPTIVTAAQAPPKTYTVDEYRAKFSDPQTIITREVYIYDSLGTSIWEGFTTGRRLISGNVSVDYTRDERRSIDVELSNFDMALAQQPDAFWYDKTLVVRRGIQFYDEWGLQSYDEPLGTFMIDRIVQSRFPKTVKVTGRDFTKKCMLKKFYLPYPFTSTMAVETLIQNLAIGADIDRYDLNTTGETIGIDIYGEPGKSYWELMKEVATAHNQELYFDAYGVLRMRDFIDPTTASTSYSFFTGAGGSLVDWDKTTNDTRIYNHIIIYGTDVLNNPVWAEAVNDNPTSPTRRALLGDRVLKYESSFIVNATHAQNLANSWLRINALEEYEINFQSLVFPWMEAGEIAMMDLPDAATTDPTQFLLTSFTVPLGLEPMSGVGRRVRNVG